MMRALIVSLCALTLLGGCKSTLMLREHHVELTRLAKGDIPPEETYERLATVIVEVYEDAMSLPNPDQRVNFIRKFAKQNDEEMRLIVSNLDGWQKSLRPLEKGRFVLELTRQPATKELIRVLPQLLDLVKDDDASMSRMRKLLLMYRVRQWLNQGDR